jgi:hypothetical protein
MVVPLAETHMPKHATQTNDPTTGTYVLPKRRRAPAEVVVSTGAGALATHLRRGGRVAQAIGAEVDVHAGSLNVLFAELRERLQALDATVAEATRAQIKGAIREVIEVVDWCDAVQVEVAGLAQRAVAGREPIDVGELCRRVAAAQQTDQSGIAVSGECALPWWGDAQALAGLVELALVLVAERTQDTGPRAIEVSAQDGRPSIRVRGFGEPADTVEPATVNRFRAAAEQLGVLVVPDQHGPGGAGLVLQLPLGP